MTSSIKRTLLCPSIHHPTLHTRAHTPGTLMWVFALGLVSLLSLLASRAHGFPAPKMNWSVGGAGG